MTLDPPVNEIMVLFSKTNFVSFQTIQQTTGLDIAAILSLKYVLESHMRTVDDDVRLHSLMYLKRPGLFLDT